MPEQTIAKSLNKAYRQISIDKQSLGSFKTQLEILYSHIDCAIHLGNSIESPVGVIIEVKMPTNASEMISKNNLNKKALQELLLYYLRERVEKKNIQLKQLIITNIHEFFIFDAQEFERVFYSNKKLLKKFSEFNEGVLTSDKTNFFYKEIAAEAI